ncbi:MAG: helix-turn-helix domain-containing protein [Planctomycetota bacterium]|jgi:AraC-like DNA-binding protein|nr:helix-turn-helix domain-containing protein [Planctomycetota bacterium]
MKLAKTDIFVERFVCAGRIGPTRFWQAAAHRHLDQHELVAVVSGDVTVRLDDGRERLLGAGDCVHYGPACLHAEATHSYRSLELFFIAWQGAPLSASVEPVHDRAGRIRQILAWLCELQLADPRCRALAESLVLEWQQLSQEGGGVETCLRRFISEHMREPIRVADLAAQLHCSERQLSRRCLADVGMTPRRLLERMRVDASRALLVSTDLGLDAIAGMVGLVDAAQLSRSVKRVCGRPPGALRI